MAAKDKTNPKEIDQLISPPVFNINKLINTGMTSEMLLANEVGAMPFFWVEKPDNKKVITNPTPMAINKNVSPVEGQ